jgi:hypothetical protein
MARLHSRVLREAAGIFEDDIGSLDRFRGSLAGERLEVACPRGIQSPLSADFSASVIDPEVKR